MDGEDEQTWVFYSAKRGIMDARTRAVPHGDERPIWATVHSGGSERIAHAVEHPRTSLPTTHVFNREGKEEGEREQKGLIEDEDDDERYCGLRHGVRASSTAVRVDAWCDAWRNRGPGAGMLRVPTAQRFRVLSV